MRPILLLLPLLSGCLTGTYTSWHTYQEPASFLRLRPGEADLDDCLEVLGAPLYVREQGDGAVLAWGWADERRFGVTFSIPLDSGNASLTYQDTAAGLDGLVLVFDADWRLTAIRRGRLAEVLPSSQSRARLIEEPAG